MNNYVCYKIPESEQENLEPLFKAYYNKKTHRYLDSIMRFELYTQYGFIWLLHDDSYELPYGINLTEYESQVFDFDLPENIVYIRTILKSKGYSCRWATRIWRTGCGSLEIWEHNKYSRKPTSVIYLTPALAFRILYWFKDNIKGLEQFLTKYKSKDPIIWNYQLTFEENINILMGV